MLNFKTNTKRQRRSASDLLNKLDKKLSNVTSNKKGTKNLNTIISKKKIKHIHEDVNINSKSDSFQKKKKLIKLINMVLLTFNNLHIFKKLLKIYKQFLLVLK